MTCYSGYKIYFLLTAVLLGSLSCTQQGGSSPNELPKDLLGIRVGMPKAEAQKRLEEIGSLEQDLQKKQQVWKLKDDTHFVNVAVQYNAEDRIRYITAFVDKNPKARIRFTEVGDISKAKPEIVEPHYRYIWEVPAADGVPAYQVVLYGDQKDFVSFYTLVELGAPAKEEAG